MATRKNRNKQGQTLKLPKYASTMYGVQNWYVREFEKLGWMVLAKAKGNDYKVESYKKALIHLKKTIDHVMKEYEDHNRKHDLNVIRMHVDVLIDYVNKHL